MQLQRKQSTGIYETIGTREGYVSVTSPSYRTFTNVKSGSDDMRIYLLYYEDDIDNIVEFYRP
ncbi:hypothetical protein [Lentibacillus kimchii]|uniref:Uncharacterized protein n=1 Tax=Lentibacillus kimchii TaxID=1542911 RepID=A0ABW2UU96_9BACI